MIHKQLLVKLGILDEVRSYIDVLLKHNINPKQIILFGSLVKQKVHKYSDIDLAIVSEDFEGDSIEAMMTLAKLTMGISDRIEPIAISSQDLSSRYNSLIGEIKKYGKVVYSS
jgi:predicted nucleotidyltransferase